MREGSKGSKDIRNPTLCLLMLVEAYTSMKSAKKLTSCKPNKLGPISDKFIT